MTVLITGGSGFIGAWIARALLARGDSVISFDQQCSARRLEMILPAEAVRRVAWHTGDITDRGQIAHVFQQHSVSHVIHLAGLQVPACRANPMLGAEVNVRGTLAVLEAAREAGIERVVYASSAAVYGPPLERDEPLGEHEHLRPSTHYGAFKLCNEADARIFFEEHGLQSVGLRPWTVYGAGRDLGMTSEPTKAIKAAVLGRPFRISFGGVTDFHYAADVAEAFVQCLVKPYRGPKAYNLRGSVASLSDFCRTLHAVIPESASLVACGDAQIAIAWNLSDAAIEADYGPLPKTSLADGIRETASIFRTLHAAGKLDVSDLDAPAPAAVTVDV